MEPAVEARALIASAKRGKCPIPVPKTRYFDGLPADDDAERETIMP